MSLDSLSAQQLTAVKKQLDEEVEHLTSSFAQLQAAQIKFKDCLRCVKTQGATKGKYRPQILKCRSFQMLKIMTDKKEILVPLTNSLYVKGNIARPDRVLVDVGTGFYIEKVRQTHRSHNGPFPELTLIA